MSEYAKFNEWIAKDENAELLKKRKIDELAKKWQEGEKGSISVFIYCLKDKMPTAQEIMEALTAAQRQTLEKILGYFPLTGSKARP